MSTQRDVIVIGAGLLGCFAARSLRRSSLSVCVLEKEADVCTGISKANSGIVYAGYDMHPGTKKAAFTVRANRRFPELCRELAVPLNRCGSLMTASGPRAAARLREKYTQGLTNGCDGLALLGGSSCRELEPLLTPAVQLGLYAPGTASVIPWELGIAAYENAAANGAEFHFCSEAKEIERSADGFLVHTERESFFCRVLVNCAGLQAGFVHEMLSPPSVRVRPEAADYLVFPSACGSAVSHVIWEEPEEKGKGLTLIPTPDGNLLVGPTRRPADARYAGSPTDRSALGQLISRCRDFIPGLPEEPILHTFGALRPNPYSVTRQGSVWTEDGRKHLDFPLLQENGFFSLIGIKTPGLTCCEEIGSFLAEQITAYLGTVPPNPEFDPTRRKPVCVRELTDPERNDLIASDPAYGRIVCSCRGITLGELQDAARSGAVTLDGLKRRTGATMGECQGSRCLAELITVLMRENGLPAGAVRKEYRNSEMVYDKK